MPRTDGWRALGFDDDIGAAQLVAPTQTTNVTPVVKPSASTGFDLTTYGPGRLLLIITALRTAQGMTFSVTQSDTTNGTYTAADTTGSLAKMTASGVLTVAVRRDMSKPFLRITATGDNAASDFWWSAVLLTL